MAIERKTPAEIKPASRLRQALRQFSAACYMIITEMVIPSLRIEDYSPSTSVESKAKADCISMKTKKDPYDAGFQVCYPTAFEDAGIHERRGIDACLGDRR